ncbi:pao retrotransposon peptidase domain-containing protein [Phthorimaea operculella]|nr:pao retrotransposon peptidase domain-containing protein [Phthorimaea operculella]
MFCDASPAAYGTVAYWRQIDSDGRVTVTFIASKSKVAPTKLVTIPRLELQGAVLACRLAESIKREHRLIPDVTYYWADSTTVLHWIKNENRNYKVFIANRLGEIDETSSTREWHYVPTDMNPADHLTKNTEYKLETGADWFTGPSFLREADSSRWPQQPETKKHINEEILEMVHTVHENTECDLPVPDPERFSSWLRLLRATATMLLFIDKCRKQHSGHGLTVELMKRAETLLLRHAQLESFASEITQLKEKKEIKRDSKLLTLSPILCEDGLLRLDSRINAAKEAPPERLTDLFWTRWMREVLPTLAPRRKWSQEGTQLKVGDVVFVADPSSPRGVWPKGVIQAVYPGKDGRVRVVDVRTSSGVKRRSAARIAKFLDDECCQGNTGGEDVTDT